MQILITGGNQGSHVINLAVEECLKELLKICHVVHLTGDSRYKDYERLKASENANYKVYKWIDNMGEVMNKADLVVSRAGINTLTELAFLNKPVLIIPVPYLYQDEQTKNAKFFEKLGLAKMLPQTQLSSKILLSEIKFMLRNLKVYKDKGLKAKEIVIPSAAKKIALETVLLGIN